MTFHQQEPPTRARLRRTSELYELTPARGPTLASCARDASPTRAPCTARADPHWREALRVFLLRQVVCRKWCCRRYERTQLRDAVAWRPDLKQPTLLGSQLAMPMMSPRPKPLLGDMHAESEGQGDFRCANFGCKVTGSDPCAQFRGTRYCSDECQEKYWLSSRGSHRADFVPAPQSTADDQPSVRHNATTSLEDVDAQPRSKKPRLPAATSSPASPVVVAGDPLPGGDLCHHQHCPSRTMTACSPSRVTIELRGSPKCTCCSLIIIILQNFVRRTGELRRAKNIRRPSLSRNTCSTILELTQPQLRTICGHFWHPRYQTTGDQLKGQPLRLAVQFTEPPCRICAFPGLGVAFAGI